MKSTREFVKKYVDGDAEPISMPEIITNPILKYKQKPTRGNAIKAKCAECVGCTEESTEVGFRDLIRTCSAYRCPLRDFRPFK